MSGEARVSVVPPSKSYAPRSPRAKRVPLSPFVPLLVWLLSSLVAALIVIVGVRDLRRQSDEAASLRAQVLSEALAARVRATSLEDRHQVLERAARRSGAELLLVNQDGAIAVDSSLSPPNTGEIVALLVRGRGETVTELGRVRFQATPLGEPLAHLTLLSFVSAPETPAAIPSLVNSVTFLTLVLVGLAVVVGYSLARDVIEDVRFVRERVSEMAEHRTEPSGRLVPVRSVDQVGALTHSFNQLVQRFAAAERAYREDLRTADVHDRDRSAFLAALSHELRTPLNAVRGFTDLLLSEVEGPLSTEARENLEVVRQSSDHLLALINDILDLSAMESGELSLTVSEIDLWEVARGVVAEARGAAMNRPLVVQLTGGPAKVHADERRVRQILGNLVSNAVKFTREGSVIVSVQETTSGASVSVTDTGPGIARDMQAAIFEEFQQAGDVHARRAGTGLGLAIARRLARMHGGRVELESELGKGSRFTVHLPSVAEEPIPTSSRHSQEHAAASTRGRP
ncbi:MAG: HAMP domain-containing histidine kinase [Polyangiaceae bacterium]|nr:HAMP domain-containing histidine kinase [Polyangiaceae bacterium]MCW5790600.1 HAMP domain-containing histidine kinase [Polyangiaceae bacterium]